MIEFGELSWMVKDRGARYESSRVYKQLISPPPPPPPPGREIDDGSVMEELADTSHSNASSLHRRPLTPVYAHHTYQSRAWHFL